ncbi:MAG TPA: MFS transporter [Myxococcota bacterium]
MRASSADAVAFSLMVGVGETYVPAFALALGATDVAAGLLASAPLMSGAVLQLVSPGAVRSLGSHRRWVVLCAGLQAASFAPLVLGAALGALPIGVLFAAMAVYWGTGMATGPTWNTWIETLVPRRIRAHYLAARTRRAQLALITGMVCGALLLGLGRQTDSLMPAFALLFAAAASFRALSASFLARQSEPQPLPEGFRTLALREVVVGAGRRADSHLLAYLLALQVAVYVAAPFFTTYMLGPLELSYPWFMLLTGTSFAAKALVLPTLGRFARRFGARRLLWLSGVGVVPLPALWTLSDSLSYLMGLQLFAGVTWAANELAVLLLFFETIPHAERTSMLTFFNLANATAMLAGSLAGAALLANFGDSREGYAMLFAVSSAGRCASLLLLRRLPDLRAAAQPIVMRTLAIRPSLGGVDRPVLASLPDEVNTGEDGAPTARPHLGV